jgi:hypothetical protein
MLGTEAPVNGKPPACRAAGRECVFPAHEWISRAGERSVARVRTVPPNERDGGWGAASPRSEGRGVRRRIFIVADQPPREGRGSDRFLQGEDLARRRALWQVDRSPIVRRGNAARSNRHAPVRGARPHEKVAGPSTLGATGSVRRTRGTQALAAIESERCFFRASQSAPARRGRGREAGSRAKRARTNPMSIPGRSLQLPANLHVAPF